METQNGARRRRWWLVGGVAAGGGYLAARQLAGRKARAKGTGATDPGAGKALPPGPRGNLVLGSIPDIARDNLGLFMDSWQRYGDIVRFRGPLTIVLPVHPDYVKHVLQDNHRNYPRPEFVSAILRSVVGGGLVAAEGDSWRRSRRLAQPAFHRQRIATFATMFADTTAAMIERWQEHADRGEAIDVKSEMMHISLANLAQALFKADLKRDVDTVEPAVAFTLAHMNRRLTSPFDTQRFPLPSSRRFDDGLRTLDSMVYPIISARRRTGAEAGDFVSMLIEARDEETGEGMNDRQVRDEIMGFFIAGHETVSTALTWTWYLLSKNPDAWRRLKAEVDEVLGGRVPTLEDVQKLTYTSMVLQEAMRLYPPIFVLMRNAKEDDEIGGHRIPAGTNVALCAYVSHRHPDFWENPEGFDPERFTPENSAGRHRMAYFPFAGGPRKCIGDSFAMLEMPIVVAMIAQRFRLDLTPGQNIVPDPAFSLRPGGAMMMHLEPLAPAPRRDTQASNGGDGRYAAATTPASAE